MAEKNNAILGFEKQIWDTECVLWGYIPAANYRNLFLCRFYFFYKNKYIIIK